MEIREFAQRVLFSTSLDEKLTPGGPLTDHEPGSAQSTPDAPGRPIDLRLRKDGVRAEFPGTAKLIDEEQRGILLHFFANHELLATELMALVLLKFPDAPPEFRLGIVRTLEEEQQHTQWYLRRMQQCGVAFGDFALNQFFWDSIAPMETPLDYVTRLSLTFEQANLDYARHYSDVLRQAGDVQTAGILGQIYRDEIGHVGYGLQWFRRWKAKGDSDWESYRRSLAFPLSPARGRGNAPFNAEGRRRAGLDESFIQEMELFSRSKGRTPNVFWFTPDAEAAMAFGLEGKGFAPRTEVRALQRDLEILPAFLAHRDDVVLLHQPPSPAHRQKLHRLGLDLPEFELLTQGGQIAPDSLQKSRKLNDLRPWAWCPQSAALLRPLNPQLVATRWNEATRSLFAKNHHIEHLGPDCTLCRTFDDLANTASALSGQGYPEGVAKSPFGAAGQKNRKFLTNNPASLRSWFNRVITQQSAVLVEPWHDRVFDFSVQYDGTPGGLKRLAFTQLFNDRRGQFQASAASGKFCHNLDPDLKRFLMNGLLTRYDTEIPAQLEPLFHAARYTGPIGIDAYVYRTQEGTLRLRPVVEINPRFTMGRLTWELMRRVAHGRSARLELVRSSHPESTASEIESNDPAIIDSRGKITSGRVVLNEPSDVLAILTVGL